MASQACSPDEPGKTVVSEEPRERPVLFNHIVVRDGDAAIKWYCDALKARVTFRYDEKETGRVLHAALDSDYGFSFDVEDTCGNMGITPAAEGVDKAPGCTYFYVTLPEGKGTCDEAFERMRKAGAVVQKEPEDTFYGHRVAVLRDIWGVVWAFSHRIPVTEGK